MNFVLKSEYLFRLFVSFLLISVSFKSVAQNPNGNRMNGGQATTGRFYGKVTDESTGKGVEYATVQLFGTRVDTLNKKREPYLVTGQLTLPNGDFSLENIPVRGEYTLNISFLGFAKIERKVSFTKNATDVDLGNIRLSASNEVLKEVTVTGEASAVSLAIDKKVYKVDKDAIAAGGTAEDALKNVPAISVDLDGNVTMRNAAPQIFVDGRPTTLTVDQIPADAIDNIEVISNPSAKYDASGGGAGIVNIVLKKERRIGYNGSVRAGIDSRAKVNFGGDLNAREGKFNAFIGGGMMQRRTLSEGQTDRLNLFDNPNTDISQTSNSTNNRLFGHGRAGVDYFIDNRNTLTFAGNFHGGGFTSDDDLNIHTDTLHTSGTTTGTANRLSNSERSFKNFGGQILYKHLFPKEGKEWTADFNYNGARNTNEGFFTTRYPTFETSQKQNSSGENNFVTVQTDFVNPIKTNLKLETGARAAIRTYASENANYEYNYGDAEYIRVPGFADRYRFDDQVFAAYGTVTHSFPKWGYQAGLRAESSFYTGNLLDADSIFTNEFPISLFPSLFLTYKLDETDNLQLNYSRRINRPSFFQMIPFTDFSDSLLLTRGNPNLIPEFTNNLEFSYQNIINAKNNFLASVYFRHSENLITTYQFTEFNTFLGREAVVSTSINSNTSIAYGVELTSKNNFLKMFELTSDLNFYNSKVNAENIESDLSVEQFTWFIKENLNVRFPKQFSLQLSGQYQSRTAFALGGGGGGHGWGGGPTSSAQGYAIPVWFVDVSLRKDLWDKKGSVSISIQDIFRSRRSGTHSESAYFIQDSWRLRDPQLVRLNFSYRFGKFDASLFKRKNNRVDGGDGMDGGF